MKQGIRALNATIVISMILVIIYLATALYSVTELFLFNQSFTFEDFEFDASDDALTISTPITFTNTGYYDINRFQITTILVDNLNERINETRTVAQNIPPNENLDLQHSLSLDFVDLLMTRQDLLFTDTVFNLTVQFNLLYAYVLEFEVEIQDTELPWGAPLAHLDIASHNPTMNSSHLLLNMTLRASNHSPFNLNGSFIFEVHNEREEYVGQGTELVYLPALSNATLPLEIAVILENPGVYMGRGRITVFFTAPQFTQPIEVWREPYG